MSLLFIIIFIFIVIIISTFSLTWDHILKNIKHMKNILVEKETIKSIFHCQHKWYCHGHDFVVL